MHEMKVSRRTLALIGGASAAATVMRPLRAQSLASPVSVGSVIATGHCAVSLIHHSDPNFPTLLRQLYPGLMADAGFIRLVSTCALLTHQRGAAVRAYKASWLMQTSAGSYSTTLYHYARAGVRVGNSGKRTAGSGQVSVLRRQGHRLVSPFFSLTPEHFQRFGVPDWTRVLNKTADGEFINAELGSHPTFQISLDAVLYARHTVLTKDKRPFATFKAAGPHAEALGQRFRVKRNAEHDEAVIVHKMLSGGALNDEVASYLHRGATTSRPSTEGPRRWYAQARRAQCAALLNHLRIHPPEQFRKTLEHLTARPKAHVTKAVHTAAV